jgi:hypothetical protein
VPDLHLECKRRVRFQGLRTGSFSDPKRLFRSQAMPRRPRDVARALTMPAQSFHLHPGPGRRRFSSLPTTETPGSVTSLVRPDQT